VDVVPQALGVERQKTRQALASQKAQAPKANRSKAELNSCPKFHKPPQSRLQRVVVS
jgi:hypothetical protein